MSKKWGWLAVAVLAFLVAAPASAQGNRFKVYAAYNYVTPNGSDELTIDNIKDKVEGSSESGWSVGFEWRLGKWAGLQFDYLNADQGIEFAGVKVAESTMSPLSASFNFHLIHTRIIDFYFGPTVSYVNWDDIKEVDTGQTVPADSEFAYGAQVGADFSLFKSIAIVAALRYTQLDISSEGESVAINPLFSTVGVAFRW